MTNADKIRRMGDTDMAYFIARNFGGIKRCSYCAIGLDAQRRCNDPDNDCVLGIFEYLGKKVDEDGK